MYCLSPSLSIFISLVFSPSFILLFKYFTSIYQCFLSCLWTLRILHHFPFRKKKEYEWSSCCEMTPNSLTSRSIRNSERKADRNLRPF